MAITVETVANKAQLDEFIKLPAKVHLNHERWVPPFYKDEYWFLNSKRNRALSYCDSVLALAFRGGEIVGRIMGIINPRHNARIGERVARFGLLECFADIEIAKHLLDFVENWSRQKGMERLVGPMGLTDQDPEGFLVEGFEHAPTLATYYNFPFIIDFLTELKYSKEVDYVVYRMDVPETLPDYYHRIYERLKNRASFALLEFTKRSHLKSYAIPILQVMNETFVGLYGYEPLEYEEMKSLADRYFPIIDPRFVKAAAYNGTVIGFMIAIPNINQALRKGKGRLGPLSLLRILHAFKKAEQLDFLLAGVKKRFRGLGLDIWGVGAMMASAWKAGIKVIDGHHQLESNSAARAVCEHFGGQVYKRYRIFQKPVNQ